jgi:hypothetical protein
VTPKSVASWVVSTKYFKEHQSVLLYSISAELMNF